MKRKLICSILCITMIFCTAAPSLAFNLSYNKKFAPSSGSVDIRKLGNGSSLTHRVTNIKYSASNIEAMKTNNFPWKAPGLDVRENESGGKRKTHGTNISTNLPNPKLDYEDNDRDGWDDELKVVIVGPSGMNALDPNKSYYFNTTYAIKTKSGTTGYNLQAEWSLPGASDYNVWDWVMINQANGVHLTNSRSLKFDEKSEVQELSAGSQTMEETTLIFSEENIENGYTLIVSQQESGLKASVEIDSENLDAFVEYNEGLIDDFQENSAGDVSAVITFNKPIGFGTLQDMIGYGSFEFDKILGRAGTADNRVTFAINNGTLDDIDFEALEESLEGEQLKGVTAIYGSFSMEEIMRLNQMEEVFLVDVTANEIEENLTRSLSGAGDSMIRVSNHSPYWDIEDLSTLK